MRSCEASFRLLEGRLGGLRMMDIIFEVDLEGKGQYENSEQPTKRGDAVGVGDIANLATEFELTNSCEQVSSQGSLPRCPELSWRKPSD
jgi:hypothetical protein